MTQCEECDEEINEKRLKAMPHTRLCVFCQKFLENNGGYALHKLDVQSKTRCGEIDTTEQILVRGVL